MFSREAEQDPSIKKVIKKLATRNIRRIFFTARLGAPKKRELSL